jgi:hypothetical protein
MNTGLAVGLRAVGTGAQMADPEGAAGDRVYVRARLVYGRERT